MSVYREKKRLRQRNASVVKLNITSMIDMFTLMVVFLLQTYSSQGQLVTPATGLQLPKSTVEKHAAEALCVKVSQNSIMVESGLVIDSVEYRKLKVQKEFMVEPLFEILRKYADEAKKSAKAMGTQFSGKISIQGDQAIPYNVLTRVMYTCGQAGFPQMNLVVYRK